MRSFKNIIRKRKEEERGKIRNRKEIRGSESQIIQRI
jgi:hypothetical protein